MTAPPDSVRAIRSRARARDAPPGAARRRMLMVAFHYPPANTPGALRTLTFTKHLGANGWDASVLTAPARLHEAVDATLLRQVPDAVRVHRAWGFDAKAAFAIRGRYPAFVETPDRYWSWLPFALAGARRIVRREDIRAVFSTSPIPTAHLVAGALAALARLPWVADIRDPLVGRPGGAAVERLVITRADHIVTTTTEEADAVVGRHGAAVRSRISTIYNGYDQDDFENLERAAPDEPVFRLTHAGHLYRSSRHPGALLEALRRCLDAGTLPRNTQLFLLGAGEFARDPRLARQLAELRLDDTVSFDAKLGHHEALAAMCAASVLVLLQGDRHSRTQVPSKAFEYLRSGRPLLVLAPSDSATAKVLDGFPAVYRANPDDPGAIAAMLETLYQQWARGARRVNRRGERLDRFERRRAAAALADVLNTLVSDAPIRAGRGEASCQ